MSQNALEHIIARYWHSSGVIGVGKFSSSVSAHKLKRMISEASSLGKYSPNTRNRPGTVVIHSFPTPIGTTGAGHLTNTMKMVISPDFTLKTAYPY